MGLWDKLKRDKAEKEEPLYLYAEQELDEYEAYIARCFGEYDKVMHEIVSPDIHLDIIMVPPTEENPFYKLVTMGMGAYRMNIPRELAEYKLEYAELVLFLPPDWNLDFSDERNYWPVRQMKVLARLPINTNSWLGYGHTVHGKAEDAPFAENTRLNSIMLLNAFNLEGQPMELSLSSGRKLCFYQMFPLYEEELLIKASTSPKYLLDMFDKEDLFPVLRINRRNYGRGKGIGCIASGLVMKEGWAVGYMYRDEPAPGMPDSGWRFLKGDEDEEYMAQTENHHVYALSTILQHDPDIGPFLDAPIGCRFIRVDDHTFVPDDGEQRIFMMKRNA